MMKELGKLTLVFFVAAVASRLCNWATGVEITGPWWAQSLSLIILFDSGRIYEWWVKP